MKTFLFIISFLAFSTSFAQSDKSSTGDDESIKLLCAVPGKMVTIGDDALVVIVNKTKLKDSTEVVNFLDYGRQNPDAIIRIRHFKPKKAKRKFGIESEFGVIRIWSKVDPAHVAARLRESPAE